MRKTICLEYLKLSRNIVSFLSSGMKTVVHYLNAITLSKKIIVRYVCVNSTATNENNFRNSTTETKLKARRNCT